MNDIFEEIKERLVSEPEHIVNLLELYDFSKIRMRNNEIRCSFEEGMNPTAVVIRLQNNENLFVKDYERSLSYDLINYIIKAKNIPFKDVINAIKKELGIESVYNFKRRVGLFNGLYDNICRSNGEISATTYPEEMLEPYGNTPNLMFLRDGISLSTQRKFGIGYDVQSQRITFPIRASTGELIGIKGRCNYTPDEYEPKYLYLVNCPMSQTLYGYSENYNSLYEGDILIFESEKSVMVCDSMGYNNAVALGSNSLSPAQTKLLLSLNPKSVTFMLDNSLPLENTKRNADILRTFCKMRELDVRYFNWQDNLDLEEKDSPVDQGKEVFEDILKYDIKPIEELYVEDEI